MDSDLVAALRSRGVTVITPLDVLLTGRSDEQPYPDPLLSVVASLKRTFWFYKVFRHLNEHSQLALVGVSTSLSET